ncbi:hypothetical protein V5799_001719 [Amblyomma americanum]|uniref:Uncharacterized protein n=1 Tax=Amblyomma americanum TaxID=6943 RepID=A0AAQ4CZD8_AMBAM
MTIRRTLDASVPESEVLGAKPKKPQRMNNMTFNRSSAESSGCNSVYNSSSNNTFTRAPPLRNSRRVYSWTVLKVFNLGGKQDARGAAGDGNKTVLSAPKESSPKEQHAAFKDRIRCKAEIVGSNIIVTRQENSRDKKLDGAATATPGTGQKNSTSPNVLSRGRM